MTPTSLPHYATCAHEYSPMQLIIGVLLPLPPMVAFTPAVPLPPPLPFLSQLISRHSWDHLAPLAQTLYLDTLTLLQQTPGQMPPLLLGPLRQQMTPQPTLAPHHTPPNPTEALLPLKYPHPLGTDTQTPLEELYMLMKIHWALPT